MNTPLNETEIRKIIDGLKAKDPDITDDNLKKSARGSLESLGVQWNEGLERKIKYCVHINPN